MSFHSLDYLLFLPAAVTAFFLTPHRWRWIVLLAASLIFYASWRIEFLSLLLLTTFVDYSVALIFPRLRGWARHALMVLSLAGNLGLLIAFKFFTDTAQFWFDYATGANSASWSMMFLLPLGISFYTFQSLSYTIDVYRGKRQPEPHLGHFAVYVMYFPQLIAGPIERHGTLMPQLKREQHWDMTRAAAGCALFLIGLFKKLVIADGLAPWLGAQIAQGETHSALQLLSISVATLYRYYCDLSGYADMAIGSALIMGVKLTQNFRRPFAAKSVTAFWQRWHTTVTNWFRDYFYIPFVQKMPDIKGKRFLGIMVTMILVGVWHGGTYNWLLVGVISGVLITISNNGRKWVIANTAYGPRLRRALDGADRALVWLTIPVVGALIAFPDFDTALSVIARLPLAPFDLATPAARGLLQFPLHLMAAIVALEAYQWLDVRQPVHDRVVAGGRRIAWSFYILLIASIIVLGTYDNPDFLYFEF